MMMMIKFTWIRKMRIFMSNKCSDKIR